MKLDEIFNIENESNFKHFKKVNSFNDQIN